MCQLILFNRKRGGDVAKLPLKTYKERQVYRNAEVMGALPLLERRMVERLDMVKTLGKGRKLVPIILTPRHNKGLATLIATREEIGVDAENKYLFARRAGQNFCKSTEVMYKMTRKAGLKKPEHLTARNLRVHVCTMARVLDLSEEHVSILADCLGHTPNVQKLIYRLPLDKLLLSKAAKVLLTVNDGVSKYAGQAFNEIEFNIDELCPDVIGDEDEDEGFLDNWSGNEGVCDADEEMEVDEPSAGQSENENQERPPPPQKRQKEEAPKKTKTTEMTTPEEKQAGVGKRKTWKRPNEEMEETAKPSTSQEEVPQKKGKQPKRNEAMTTPTKQQKLKRFTRTPTKAEDMITWTTEDKEDIKKHFALYFRRKGTRPPQEAEIKSFLSQHPRMNDGRSWRKVKSQVYYLLQQDEKRKNEVKKKKA